MILRLCLDGAESGGWCQAPVERLIIAGWTGRDPASVQAHIEELRELGVPAPARTPVFYRAGASLLTTDPVVDVVGTDSTGEVEFVLLSYDGEWWVGAGSDHTDRKAEPTGITLAKQLCPKPVAPRMWNFGSIEAHWDELILRSYVVSGCDRALYQEGCVSAMRSPRDLVRLYNESTNSGFLPGAAMFGGTLPVRGEIRWAETFVMELEDPVRQRKITHEYRCRVLPVEG
jgi:hypothetical protein